ncbi:MAG TPA: hypothetical protein VF158_04590, partial [Longimicrobiales bacterium]
MHASLRATLAVPAILLAIGVNAGAAQDADRVVASGGIFAPGWAGAVDPRAAARGQTIEHASFAAEGDAFHVTTGPAATYWKTDERLTGDYTVSATFTEPAYMNLNDHPHPYGIVIAGNDMGTDGQSFLYCAAYGSGRFIVRGFGPEPFQLNGRRGETHEAVNQAPGRNQPVTQEIAMSVRDGTVSCTINGTVVARYPASEVVGAGRLASTDGAYGIRAAH